MLSKKGPPGDGGLTPSDAESREKLVLYVYEYLLHMGAKQAAATFLQEIHWDKNITTIQDPPGFLQSWWCVFWDLYCAAPERRDTHRYSTEAKTFHDFAFVNSGYSANGLHGPNPSPSPLGMPGQIPDGVQPGSAGVGPPHAGFFPPAVPGQHMRPSPPQQASTQPSPHGIMNQAAFMNSARYQGPNGRGNAGVRLGQESQAPFLFPDQIRGLMPPQRPPQRPTGPNGYQGVRPNMGAMMGGVPPGPAHLQRSWSGSSAPPSNGPTPAGPGTPQSLPDGTVPDRFGMIQPGGGPALPQFSVGSEPAVMRDMLMNGDGLDIKHSPASAHGGLNGGTPGPAGPSSVPPSTSGESCSLDFVSAMHPFQATHPMDTHDRLLAARIKQYMEQCNGGPIDTLTVVKHLQSQYKEYERRKRVALASAVRSVCSVLHDTTSPDHRPVNDNRKRKKDGGGDWEDMEGEREMTGPNLMNSSLSTLYRSGRTRKGEGDGRRRTSKIKTGSAEKTQKDATVLEISTVTFADVGGCETELLELCRLLVRMKTPEIYRALGVDPPRGLLLHGPPGCGKTLLAYAIAGELKMPFIKLAATELVSGVSGDSEQRIRVLFDQASAYSPCLLFVDEIDAIAPRRDTAQREMERRMVAQFVSCLDDVRTAGEDIILMGATSRPDALDPALRRAGRFDKEIALGIPNDKARKKILQVLCRRMRLEADFDFDRLSRLCPGYVGADLSALAAEATACAMDRAFDAITGPDDGTQLNEMLTWVREGLPFGAQDFHDLCVTMNDFQIALKKVSPSSKREGFATVPDVSWRDVGAMGHVREELKWAILYPIQHPEVFEALRLDSRAQGILLCGPPGCGKTLLAKAVSNETAMNFISVKGPELINMYVGESERAVREVFQRARNSAPCVIFFDELDALCPERSSFDTGASARVVNQLLSEMDGVESRRQVFIIGATNRPDMIDPAVLRPGRLDKIVYVGFPTVTDRAHILGALTREDRPRLGQDVDLSAIAADPRAQWFTGADLAALVRESCMVALKNMMHGEGGDGPTAVSSVVLRQQHFDQAFSRVKPSVQRKERERYLALEKKYGIGKGAMN